ncbi:MAG: hypothetical protein QXL94_02960 [Candidatus Parvarchaeum sp.]
MREAIESSRNELERSHTQIIENKFVELKNSIEETLRSNTISDKSEKEELKADLNKVKEFIAKLHESQESAKGKSTIVIPATTVATDPTKIPQDKTSESAGQSPQQVQRKSRLSGWW